MEGGPKEKKIDKDKKSQDGSWSDSDGEDFKIEKPLLNALQRKKIEEIEENILTAMDISRETAKKVDDIQQLDYGSLEIILRISQKAISDLKEIRQKQSANQSFEGSNENQSMNIQPKDMTQAQQTKQVKQVCEYASNAYELLSILDQLKMNL